MLPTTDAWNFRCADLQNAEDWRLQSGGLKGRAHWPVLLKVYLYQYKKHISLIKIFLFIFFLINIIKMVKLDNIFFPSGSESPALVHAKCENSFVSNFPYVERRGKRDTGGTWRGASHTNWCNKLYATAALTGQTCRTGDWRWRYDDDGMTMTLPRGGANPMRCGLQSHPQRPPEIFEIPVPGQSVSHSLSLTFLTRFVIDTCTWKSKVCISIPSSRAWKWFISSLVLFVPKDLMFPVF